MPYIIISKGVQIAEDNELNKFFEKFATALAGVYVKKGLDNLALEYYNLVLENYYTQIELFDKIAYIGERAKLYEKNNQWKQATADYHVLHILKDSLNNKKSNQKLAVFLNEEKYQNLLKEEKYKYEIEQARLKSALAEEKSTMVITAVLAVSLLLILLILWFFYRKLGYKNIQLLHNSRVQQNFIAILSHDMRSPLASIKSLLNVIEESPDEFSEQEKAEMIKTLGTNVDITIDTMDEILYWVHTQLSGVVINKENFNVFDVVENIVILSQVSLEEKNITVENNVPNNCHIYSDKTSIALVLKNLIQNAIKFSKKGGVIKVNGTLSNNTWTFEVADNGIGMNEEQKSKIFASDIDSQLGTNGETGTGLGLLNCKKIIEALGQKIWFHSKVNQGTAFLFDIDIKAMDELS
ncbi:MAG: sensor histidine kinase [Salibacteraceae bacterium]